MLYRISVVGVCRIVCIGFLLVVVVFLGVRLLLLCR